jgi:hypothetical protein
MNYFFDILKLDSGATFSSANDENTGAAAWNEAGSGWSEEEKGKKLVTRVSPLAKAVASIMQFMREEEGQMQRNYSTFFPPCNCDQN